MTLRIILFIILAGSTIAGKAQTNSIKNKVVNNTDLNEVCKNLPKFQYNKDSTEIIYNERIDLNSEAALFLDGIILPQLGPDAELLFNQLRKNKLKFVYWYLPTGGIDLSAKIELIAEGKSLFIKVYKTKVFYEESKKYIPMGK